MAAHSLIGEGVGSVKGEVIGHPIIVYIWHFNFERSTIFYLCFEFCLCIDILFYQFKAKFLLSPSFLFVARGFARFQKTIFPCLP
jgi:hypothetical protein